MIDAKAPGLASWVKSLGKINYYADNHIWQNEAVVILSKMHLLTSAFQNLANLPGDMATNHQIPARMEPIAQRTSC